MSVTNRNTPVNSDRDLLLNRDIAASAQQLYRCWTEPALIRQWFAPKPWTVPEAHADVHPGGSSLIIMRGPDGEEFRNPGVYLEVVPDQRLVITDAYTSAWELADEPLMTLIVSFDDLGNGRTRYTALARHWTVAARERHEAMGFLDGWSRCADPLAELAVTP